MASSGTRKTRRPMMTLIALVLAAALVCTGAAVVLAVETSVRSAVVSMVDDDSYYIPQAKAMEQLTKELAVSHGIPESTVEGVYDGEEVIAFTKEYTAGRLNGFESELMTAAAHERLRANVYGWLESESVDKSRLNMDTLNAYLDEAVTVYSDVAQSSLVKYYPGMKAQVGIPAAITAAVTIIVAILCLFLLYKISGMRRKMLSYGIRAMLSASILSAVVWAWYIIAGKGTVLSWSPAYMEGISRSLEAFFFNGIGICAIVWGLCAAVSAIVMNQIKHHRGKN